jgi:long-chain acyl-CoA synthetase
MLMTAEARKRHSVAEYVENFRRRGREPAYVQRRGYRIVRWSYGQVAETAFRVARALHARGIAKGDRVLIWGANSAEWVAAFLGCSLRGIIVVPMDDSAAPDFARRVAEQVSVKLAVCGRGHAGACGAFPVLILEDLAEAVSSQSGASYSSAAIEAGDALEIVFTSGTTAEPKGVVISHDNVLGNVLPLEAELQKYLKYERLAHPIRFLNLLPLSHMFGQFLGIFLPQLMGGTVVFQETLKPGEVMSTIKRERVSVLVGVPRLLQSLKEKVERDEAEEGRLEKFRQQLRTVQGKQFLRRWWIFRRVHRQLGWKFWAFVCGGAALDRETEEFWGGLGYAVIQGYGLTETTSLISLNHPFRVGKGSIGKVLAGREVKLGPEGEILVRGSGVAAGYWSGQEVRPVTGDEGWYSTGDIGEMDAAGNLYFKGRKKDVIVTPAGMNIYPEDLEAALRRQPEIKDCAVVALARNGNAEPCATLLLRENNGDAEGAVQRANQALAAYQRIKAWLVWPEKDFPRTSTQKVKLSEIQRVAEAKWGQASSEGRPSPLAEIIRRTTGDKSGKFGFEGRLDTELNLSSLERVELLGALEERYQLDLSETSFAAVNTVAELESMLQGQLAPRVQYHYTGWVQRWPATWIRLIAHYLLLRPAVFALGWPRQEGKDNLKGVSGPVLVVCNHSGDVDVGFVHTVLPARLRHKLATATGGEALESLRTPPAGRGFLGKAYDRVKWTLGVSLLNLFPLPREAGFRQSFAFAGESVDRGYNILVFPEGRHTTDGKLGRFRAGIGLLANNLRIPVVPMRIDGLYELKHAGKKFALPYTVRVKIGKPVSFAPDSDPEWIAKELQRKVEEL